MKLHDRTNTYFVLASLIIYCIGGILFYLLFDIIVDRDYNHKLHDLKYYTLKQIERSDSVIMFQQYSTNTISIKPIHQFESSEVLSDTVIFDNIEQKDISFRQLTFYARIRGHYYIIQLRRSLLERTEFIEGVIVLVILLFVFFATTLSIINNKLSRILWAPFQAILEKINNYQIDHAENLEFPTSQIEEFNMLAADISKMTNKIHNEFNIQREFIENASHEIQTPLAIVSNKMEILLQSPGLSQTQLELVNSSILAVRRLSKLNEALLIISRIENRQFHYMEDISINMLLDQHLSNLGELIQNKSLAVEKVYSNKIIVAMNPFLADILLENIITNAIRHNAGEGFIHISSKGALITISNSGNKPTEPTSKIFQRFSKLNKKSKSVGLGMAIVKAICDMYDFEINYAYTNGNHVISIGFSNATAVVD